MSEATLCAVVTWRIENFSGWYDHDGNGCICSDDFSPVPGLALESNIEGIKLIHKFEIINDKGLSENASSDRSLFFMYDEMTCLKQSVLLKESPKYLPGDILTVSCKIWSDDSVCEVQRLLLRTCIPIEKHTFDWMISKFLQSNHTPRKEIVFETVFGTPYTYRFSFQYIRKDNDKNVEVRVCKPNKSLMAVTWKCEMQTLLKDTNFLTVTDKTDSKPYKYKKSFCPQISWRKISENADKYLSNGTLPIRCSLTLYSNKVEHFENKEYEALQPIKSENVDNRKMQDLKTDLLLLYRNGLMSDFKVHIGSKMIPTHSVILAARSPVFRTMLETNMIEKKDKILKIEDDFLDEHTMCKLLDYLYSDNLGKMCVDSALKLYYAADKYQILGIKTLSAEFLMKHIDASNVCKILLLADRRGEKELKISAIEFIARHETDIVVSEEFQAFSRNNSELGVEVLLSLSEMRFKLTCCD